MMNAPSVQIPAPADMSLIGRAKAGDRAALETMFRQFISEDETIHSVEYLGMQGIFDLFGEHSFGCLTDRRVATIRTGPWGAMVYQDGYLEGINSAVFYQPSLLGLYLLVGVLVLAALTTFGLTLLMIPFAGKWYYRVHKSGLVLAIREGISVYVFTNRNQLSQANRMWRACTRLRDQRVLTARPGL
jgi:hypothetical protein